MNIDGIILNKINKLFIENLPMKINKITGISDTDLVINVRCSGQRKNIFISTHSVNNRIHFTNKNYLASDYPSNFVMVLRKYLNNGIIYDVVQNDYDRYLIFKIKSIDELYDDIYLSLYIELMGKYANAILVNDQSNKIIDALKKIPPFENTKRTIQVGANFINIPPQEKINPFKIDEAPDNLTKELQGFSPLLEKEVLYRIGNNEKFVQIMKDIETSQQIYVSKNNFHLIALNHLDDNHQCYKIEEAFDIIYDQATQKTLIKAIANDLFKIVKRQIKHFQTKIIKLQQSILEANGADKFKEAGDYLFMSGKLQLKGIDNIDVYDYDGKVINILLNPKLNIKDNANKYYQRYQKLKKGLSYQEKELDIANKNLDYFLSLNEQLEFSNYNDALEIKDELIKLGYLKAQKQKRNSKKNHKNPNIYKVIFNDKLIMFGKNNIQNSFLTFKIATKKQTFFHAKDYHGAHVVIDSDNPSEAEIRLCAQIAAYFSGGRNSSSIPVDYCLIKDVKKITGAKAAITNQKTIYIDVDFDLLRGLGII